jgi:hypothetical protein
MYDWGQFPFKKATVSIGSDAPGNNAFSQRCVSTLQMNNTKHNRVTHRSWSIIKVIINSFITDKEAQKSMTHLVKHSMKQTYHIEKTFMTIYKIETDL